MDIPTPPELVAKIEAFIKRHQMAETRFGRDSVGDPNLISDVRAGKRLPGIVKLNKIADYMARKDAELGGGDHAEADTSPVTIPSPGNGSANSPMVAHG